MMEHCQTRWQKKKKAELQVSLLITFATFSGHCHHSVYEPFSHFIFIAYTKATDHFNTAT